MRHLSFEISWFCLSALESLLKLDLDAISRLPSCRLYESVPGLQLVRPRGPSLYYVRAEPHCYQLRLTYSSQRMFPTY